MSDLLQEAIADAKAVRETALQNAKMALEEAFTPQLKSMLSAKLKEDEIEEGEPVVEEEEDEEEVEETISSDDTDTVSEEPVEEPVVEEEEEDDEDVEEGRMSAGHDDEEAEEGHGMHDEDDDEDDLDLEAVIRELESELSEGEDEEDDEAEEGRGMKESEESVEEPVEEGEEEYEIDEAALTEEDDEEDEVEESVSEDTSELSDVQAELKEYKEAVHFLKDKLHEVNILNAKLLFTNKLFKEFALDNGQKLKVVETFDRAQTTREIKLVYSTLAEQFGDNSTINRKSIKESASAPVASTKPSKEVTKVISEETEVANRFKKLAGLING
tara:strand:+ start:243 stop:1229 length:987 start_codon:yes stop_codon:yes gene_type:complete